MGKRNFEELSVLVTGVQRGEDRFGKRRRYDLDADVPRISQWRCNLTGLSQEHNLYFVAYEAEIYVYIPQFPTQTISRDPALIVPSQPSRQGLLGYLDPREPHAINNLVVQHLGNDEVVATARDDGDVDVILVRHVLQAIEKRIEPGSAVSVVADEVKPIFQSNVGMSAWGLAIHSDARILATSSNTHEVRVFKFGLLHEEEKTVSEVSSNEPVLADDGLTPDTTQLQPPANNHSGGTQRHMDVTQRVLNGDANIPYIAFCNTGDDPHARWLLTTDISGYCRIMDLHSSQGGNVTAQQFRFRRSPYGDAGGFDPENAGWAIMFLDPRSFLPEKSFHAAVGLPESESLPSAKGIWDLSNTIEQVPQNAEVFVPREVALRRAALDREATSSPDDDSEMQDAVTVEQVEMSSLEEEDGRLANGDSDSQEDFDNSRDNLIALVDDNDPEDDNMEDDPFFNRLIGGAGLISNSPYFWRQRDLCQDLPCPILHASVKNVYLLQPSNQQHFAGPFSPPMVGMENPLRQAVQFELEFLNIFERLNMNAYIPALGVVVLASQKGRALVLSLTRLQASADYPPNLRDQAHKNNYAMRVDRILPFAEQERQNERPVTPLHGVAVSPVQGAGQKRWRLLMMYQDHSILSYELSRRPTRDSAVDIARLVI